MMIKMYGKDRDKANMVEFLKKRFNPSILRLFTFSEKNYVFAKTSILILIKHGEA